MFGGTGTAYLHSESNKDCRANVEHIPVGVYMSIPDKLKEKMEIWKVQFNGLPDDLEFGWHKD